MTNWYFAFVILALLKKSKRILIAPLNWGLGHVTRCIPIIEILLAQGAEVILASDGGALRLLKQEYPALPAFKLPAYEVRYGSRSMVWNMAWQLPRIGRAVRREYGELQKLVKAQQIDIVISDNRYGCYSPATHNIFLTHQLNIQMPNRLLDFFVAQANKQLLQRFDEIWVPDLPSLPNLSGDLSHPAPLSKVHYLGLLSRMRHYECPRRYDIAIVLSGPEPQRSYLENQIRAQLSNLSALSILLVQGVMKEQKQEVENGLETVSYLTSSALNEAMLSADLIICRPGYSSLMDLAMLRRKALLIPTPGQTEQEYLAKHLQSQGLFYAVAQKELDLAKAVEKAKTYPGFTKNSFKEINPLAKIIEERI